MARRRVPEKAFVIACEGRLLDAGVVLQCKARHELHRLPLSPLGRGRTPEQLGLLFVSYALERVGDSSRRDAYLIYPDTCGPVGHNESDFPGLALYMKKHFGKIRERLVRVRRETEKGSGRGSCGGDWAFQGDDFSLLFKIVHTRAHGREVYGIRPTGNISPGDVLLLEVGSERDKEEVFTALRAGDLSRLNHFRIDRKDRVQSLMRDFHIAVATAQLKVCPVEGARADAHAIPEDSWLLSTRDTPRSIRQRIETLWNDVTSADYLLMPVTWADRCKGWQRSLLPRLFARFAQARDIKGNPVTLRAAFCMALTDLCQDDADAELVLAAVHEWYYDENAAVANARRYVTKHAKDGGAWIMLGRCYIALGQEEEARRAFAQAIRGGERVVGKAGMACTYRRPADRGKALDAVDEALAEDPRSVVARAVKVNWTMVYGDAQDALGSVDALISERADCVSLREQRVACLYALKQYRDAIEEGCRILATSKRPDCWTRYLVAAALHCVGDNKNAKDHALKALAIVKANEANAYIHIILRRIAAVYDLSPRDAVRHSAAVCRLSRSMPTAPLWLAADLEWARHPNLARRFWETKLDYEALRPDEAVGAMLLYARFGHYLKAALCAASAGGHSSIAEIATQIPPDCVLPLCTQIHGVMVARLMKVMSGDWRKPFEANKTLARALPNDLGAKLYHYVGIGLLAGWVRDEETMQLWDEEFGQAAFEEASGLAKCTLCGSAYRSWFTSHRYPQMAERLAPLCARAVNQLTSHACPDVAAVLTTAQVLIALADIGTPEETESLVAAFAEWAADVEPGELAVLYGVAVERVMIQLLRFRHLPATVNLARLVLNLMNKSGVPKMVRRLARVASEGCIAAALVPGLSNVALKIMELLELQIAECVEKHGEGQYLPDARANLASARVIRMCYDNRVAEADILECARMSLERIGQSEAGSPQGRDQLAIVFLGSVAMNAANAFRDGIVPAVMGIIEKRFGTSDEHARLVALMKRDVSQIVEKRPVAIGGLVRPQEQLDRVAQWMLDTTEDCKDMMFDGPPELKAMIEDFLEYLGEHGDQGQQ